MPRYEDPRPQSQNAPAYDGPPDPAAQIIRQLLAPWVHHNGPLPPPCPRDLRECVAWWLQHMQEPEGPTETTQCSAVAGGMRWETGYANRCRASLLSFLAMTDPERQSVVNMVTRDHIPYRGESFAQYCDIAEETIAMRRDPPRYKRDAIRRLDRAYRAMSVTA